MLNFIFFKKGPKEPILEKMKVSHTLGGAENGVPEEMEGDKRWEICKWRGCVLEKTQIFNLSKEIQKFFPFPFPGHKKSPSLSLSLSLWVSLAFSLCLSIYLSFIHSPSPSLSLSPSPAPSPLPPSPLPSTPLMLQVSIRNLSLQGGAEV